MTHPILDAIKTKNWTRATEQFTALMEQKVAARLSQERTEVGKSLTESTDQCTAKHKGGAVCRLKADHDGKHQATAGEAHYIWEEGTVKEAAPSQHTVRQAAADFRAHATQFAKKQKSLASMKALAGKTTKGK